MSESNWRKAIPSAVWDVGSSIIRQIAPDEIEDYSLLVQSYSHAESYPDSAESDSDRFGFGVNTEFVVVSAHIITGLLAMFETFVVSRRIQQEKVTVDQLKHAWVSFLVNQGLSKELAEAIPARDAAEMLRILEAAAKNREGTWQS
jgi:hypothetical protein